MLQAKLNEYEGCDFGIYLHPSQSQNIYLNIVEPCGVTPFVSIPSNCVSITIAYYLPVYGNGQHLGAWVHDNSNNIAQYNYTVANSRTITPSAGQYKEISLLFNIDEIDNCYIKDNTNNQYLWKGKNVT